jgi:hypothetical protein
MKKDMSISFFLLSLHDLLGFTCESNAKGKCCLMALLIVSILDECSGNGHSFRIKKEKELVFVGSAFLGSMFIDLVLRNLKLLSFI